MWKNTSSQADAGGTRSAAIDWQAALASHDHWLRTVVYSRLREPEAVDEVMQEVALAAVRQASPLADPAKVAPWLYRLAVRQSLLFRRKCGRRRRLTNRYAERLPTAEHDRGPRNPLDWLLQAERCQVVRHALRRLAPRDAEILLLKYREDWSYHQIAAHLGVSHSAVETRLHRARNRLRAELTAVQFVEVG
jgi:RNA polymerase sigma factor (sigma-70 family)